ncbi:MAG: DUF3524 domain-containing protein [Pirellulaceae bacterium]
MTTPLHVLAIEPYYGGSHRVFLDSIEKRSAHDWTLVTGPARHWKWRMRSSPLALSTQTLALKSERAAVNHSGQLTALAPQFDAIFCSDMLDLPAWLGFIACDRSAFARSILELPIATYFHETQWDYPVAPAARVDHHYGYTNLLTAAASDACWFNSQFHRDVFFDSCRDFVRRMPDWRDEHDLAAIASKSKVIAPGFEAVASLPEPSLPEPSPRSTGTPTPIRIGWVSRWEHDKRPDQFYDLLCRLDSRAIDFQLVLLGDRQGDELNLLKIQERFSQQILINQFATSRDDYRNNLAQIDVVVSTADHEFFGIGICEAIDAGAVPVLPDRLSYRELVPSNPRYQSLDEAAALIDKLIDPDQRCHDSELAKRSIEHYRSEHCINALDESLTQLAGR